LIELEAAGPTDPIEEPLQSAVRLTLRNLSPSENLLQLIREHVSYLEPYEDHFVRCHLELAQVGGDYHAHIQLILERGDVIRIFNEEGDPGYSSPGEALTASLARAITQLSRARSTLPPDQRPSSYSWTRA
jgi:hypothetical protein